MADWFAANWGNLLVGGILLLAIAAIVAGMVKKHRSGGCGCGCGCCGKDCGDRH